MLLLCHRVKIPSLVGFMLTGVIAGPEGLKLVSGLHEVDLLADIGVILLLFTIGMEFSLKSMFEMKRVLFFGGGLQVFLTGLGAFAFAEALGRPAGEAVFLGCLLSLSSTAIVLKVFEEKRESNSPQGRLAIAILVFQDLLVIPMMLLVPLLAGVQTGDESVFFLLGKAVAILAITLTAATIFVPKILHIIAKTRSRELFLLSVLAVCLIVTSLAASVGLSLSLGAFLAGLILSDTEYRHQAIGDILPFQTIFTSFFFVSIGMLLNVDFLFAYPHIILGAVCGVLLLKSVVAGFVVHLFGFPLRTVILTGLSISQIGEFSFVLAKSGFILGLGSEYYYHLFIAVSLITMALTPYIMEIAPWVASCLLKLPLPERVKAGTKAPESKTNTLSDHVIVIGFGISGKNIARACQVTKIPYVIIEINPDIVASEKAHHPIFFGDATRASVLEHANIDKARAIAIVIDDPKAVEHLVQMVRKARPGIYIVVRTKSFRDAKKFYVFGADEVITDEFESSIEVFVRILQKYLVAKSEVEQFIASIREERSKTLRGQLEGYNRITDIRLHLAEIEIDTYRISKDSRLAGRKLSESSLRKDFGLTVLLIKRGDEIVSDVNSETILEVGDVVVLFGTQKNLSRAVELV